MYGSHNKQNPPVIVIDGYNLLFRAMALDSEYYEDADFSIEKDKLERELRVFSMHMGVKIAVAYDAAGYKGDDLSSSVRCRRNAPVLDIFYCFDCEADTGILIEVDRLLEEGAELVLVVTSDNSVRRAAFNPPLVFVKRTELFLQELVQYRQQTNQKVKELNSIPVSGKLRSSLSSGTLQDLSSLRSKLEKKGSKDARQQEKKKDSTGYLANGKAKKPAKVKQVGCQYFCHFIFVFVRPFQVHSK